jgi:hypothetical protein
MAVVTASGAKHKMTKQMARKLGDVVGRGISLYRTLTGVPVELGF